MKATCVFKRIKRFIPALLVCLSLLVSQYSDVAIWGDESADPAPIEPESGPHGSGSYQLNKVGGDYRFYTEYFVKADTKKTITTAGIDRRTAVKVYAKAGEIILFGSSVAKSKIDVNNNLTNDVTKKDIVITTPTGQKIGRDVLLPNEVEEETGLTRPNGLGYIKNPTQEMYGPMVNHADETDPEHKYYVPLQYVVTSSGVYTFEFHSTTGFNPNSAASGDLPSPKKANDSSAWAQGNTSVAAWDVTVLGKVGDTANWEVKSGRAWADYLALTTGGGENQSDLNVHVLTHDGYQYSVNFKQASPFGFVFFANNTGFMTAATDEDDGSKTYNPIYHSFYDSSNDLDHMEEQNIYLHKPNEADTTTQETYKIFFNKPSADLDGVTYTRKTVVDGVLSEVEDTIETAPADSVTIDHLKFSGIGNSNNVARAGHGGYFTFTSDGEAMVTIRMDLRKAIFESESTMDTYEGSGIVEITAPAYKTEGDEVNRVYWDGKDTEGVTLPAGIYGNNNVVLSTEIKRGELHFPVIDMEGLKGGLTVKRLNGSDTDSPSVYNIYYNNNPLAYGTIEGTSQNRVVEGNYNKLSDGTKSYRLDSASYFKNVAQKSISTLAKDDKQYLSKKLFDKDYVDLEPSQKSIIDAEFGKEQDTFHFEPVNSNSVSMQFSCSGYVGGGNQAGIDAWTYYSQGISSTVISFAIMGSEDRGLVTGRVFYDANVSSTEDGGDYSLPGMKVRLIDKNGNPLVHEENLPCFDETGHFIYENGKVKHKKQNVQYEAVTDSTGTYRFTGVPYSSTEDTTYYVQVLLSDVQSEVMRYTCTTSQEIKESYKASDDSSFVTGTISSAYGADGNKIETSTDITKIYKHRYQRNEKHETIFDKGNTKNIQKVVFTASVTPSDIDAETGIRTQSFKKIGYSSTVPSTNQKDYKIVKNWGANTNPITDGLIVELWVWNDTDVQEEHNFKTNRRTGALVDTQVLHADTNPDKNWTYTWKNLDDRLQYFVLEYYTKKKPNGEVMYNDDGSARKVLIGGTMPIFSTVPSEYAASGIYGFQTDLGEYPEPNPVEYPAGSGKWKIPIQKFSENDSLEHANSITKTEKLEAVDNNARQYTVTYTLSKTTIGGRETNVIKLYNSQVYDDRTYYVWLNHETELPKMIEQTYVADGEKKSVALTLEKDDATEPLEDGSYRIKGLSVSSLDAAEVENKEGNATSAFRLSDDCKPGAALFTATNHGNYKTGTGTRTYQVEYVVNASTKKPVSVTTNDAGDLVLLDKTTKVKGNASYIVYSWIMTIHVYDVVSDDEIEYDPKDGTVLLQEALGAGEELTWDRTVDPDNENAITYESDDSRSDGIFSNDTYRVPLYKSADNPHMGSCADLVGIAYAGSTPNVDVSNLKFEDTYESRYGISNGGQDNQLDITDVSLDGTATVVGTNGVVTANLTVPRNSRINRKQDHANYAEITFKPNKKATKSASANAKDVFYYKIVVFAEDSTYQTYNYEDIDATEGVVMYSYFTMKPKHSDSDDKDDPGDKPDDVNPKTGDDNRLLLWYIMFAVGVCLIAVGVIKKRRY